MCVAHMRKYFEIIVVGMSDTGDTGFSKNYIVYR